MSELLKQILIEIDNYSDQIGNIEFGQVVIEVKHNKVALVTWINTKTPKKQANLFDKK